MRDLLVAGGGPVGLAVAIEARLRGLTVAVVEPRAGPVDKACGEGLMPAAVAALHTLGVAPSGHRFTGIRYVDGGRSVQAAFRHGAGLGVRRTTLHAALASRAEALGVERVLGRVGSIWQGDGHVEAAGLAARWLVGADGLHSGVRRSVGLDVPAVRGDAARFGHRAHFGIPPWTDQVEVHWAPTGEAYVTPVADDLVGVAVLCAPGHHFAEVLDDLPDLRELLGPAAPVTRVRAAGPLRQASTARVRGRVLLAGDAAGYVDALTGEGITIGLVAARAAVQCVAAGRPQDYEAAWRDATRRYRWLTATMLHVAQSRRLRTHVVPAAARLPVAFRGAVNLLAG